MDYLQRGDLTENPDPGNHFSDSFFKSRRMTTDVKYDITPYDCTPGTAWDSFEERLLNQHW